MRVQSQLQTARQRPGNQFGLVISALAQARGVKWHGYNDIRLDALWQPLHNFREAIGKPFPERTDSFMFQKKDCARHGRVVESKTPPYVESIGSCAAKPAKYLLGIHDDR